VARETKAPRTKEGRMSLGDHLVEFRKRLLIAAIAIVLAMVAGWFLSDWVWDMLRQPVEMIAAERGRNAQINYEDVTGAFDLKLKISLFIAVFLASPIWLYQIWAFLSPGLTGREKRWGIAFLGSALPLFLLGAYMGWSIIPNIVRLLTSFGSNQDAMLLSARAYLDFATKLLLAVGVGFVIPVFIVLLNFVGILSAKAIFTGWRIAILSIILFAAITTPAADVMSMFLLAGPMILLYFMAGGVAFLHDRRVEKRRVAEFAEYGLDDQVKPEAVG
jgi:sec-independent protein translocase protein TatC